MPTVLTAETRCRMPCPWCGKRVEAGDLYVKVLGHMHAECYAARTDRQAKRKVPKIAQDGGNAGEAANGRVVRGTSSLGG